MTLRLLTQTRPTSPCRDLAMSIPAPLSSSTGQVVNNGRSLVSLTSEVFKILTAAQQAIGAASVEFNVKLEGVAKIDHRNRECKRIGTAQHITGTNIRGCVGEEKTDGGLG
jgi:hypothetical protein